MRQSALTHIVRVTRTFSIRLRASTAKAAREKAWKDIKGGYTYGYKNKTDFMRRAKVTRI